MSSSIPIPKELEAPKRNLCNTNRLSAPGDRYATQVTVDMACRCPHLDVYFPKYLDSGSLGLFNEDETNAQRHQHDTKRPKRTTISDLHFTSILPTHTENSHKVNEMGTPKLSKYPFGKEEQKTDMIVCGGAEYFTPLYPATFVDQVQKERAFELCRATSELNSTPSSSVKDTKKRLLARGQGLDDEECFTMQNQRDLDVQAAVARTETWLEVIRQNRLNYWRQRLNSQKDDSCDANCKSCVKKSKRSKSHSNLPSGDALMQCLDCSLVGCGSDSFATDIGSKRHMQQHFLLSNHNFAITCGERGEIFCMKCHDFVYTEVFDNEKERMKIEANIPWFSWDRRRTLQRSFGFGDEADDFFVIPDGETAINGRSLTKFSQPRSGTVVWRGFQATYPQDVPDELILAAQRTLRRLRMFQGESPQSDYITLDKTTSEFALRQRERGPRFWAIDCPVGMYVNFHDCAFEFHVLQPQQKLTHASNSVSQSYNAGNICYIVSPWV